MSAGNDEILNSEFLKLVQQRRSCRNYDASRDVSAGVIRHCLKAAQSAPSACNCQPWRFIIVRSAELRQRFYDEARMPGIAHKWWLQVPVLVVLCAKLNVVTHKAAPAVSGISYWLLDMGIAGEHFVLAAQEQGLGSCWIGWFQEKAVKKICAIPKSVRVASLLAIGYPADSAQAWREPQRLELADIAFAERWEQPHKD